MSNREKALLVALKLPGEREQVIQESLDELSQLVASAGGEEVIRVVQERSKPTPAYFIGRGKAEEIGALASELKIEMVVFDHELSPGQQRNLERTIEQKIIDRTGLILDIFSQRAHTKEGKLQVELAQLNYFLPRLVGKGLQLSQLGGGIGTRGPGETQLEVDRRRIRRRIVKVQKDLEEVRRHRKLYRRKRKSIPLPVVALVGYTNAGKSTLFNALTTAGVLVENKLFATLDPTTRRLELPGHRQVLFSDTVGFIRKLPYHLVAAFKATLEELTEADLLLHIIDANHPEVEEQVISVRQTLKELGLDTKPALAALNKIDKLKNKNLAICLQRMFNAPVGISALYKQGIAELLEQIGQRLSRLLTRISLCLPYNKQTLLPLIYRQGRVLEVNYLPQGVQVEAEVDFKTAAILDSQLHKITQATIVKN